MNYTITKIRTFNGREGQGLNATICEDGKAICYVLDDASGGDVELDYRNPKQTPESFHATTPEMAKAAQERLEAFALAWYASSGTEAADRAQWESWGIKDGRKFERSGWDAVNSWVNHFVDEMQNKKRLDRVAKTKTLFRIDGDKPDEWRTIAKPFGPDVREFLTKKYPGAEVYGVGRIA